jgi:hypothetical protein
MLVSVTSRELLPQRLKIRYRNRLRPYLRGFGVGCRWPMRWTQSHNQSLRVNPATSGDTFKYGGIFDGTFRQLRIET